ncbi:MAG: RNA polymerase sigma factor [Bacteroidales bacterium]|jgi:RNA polymerase sigma-70 factor (ECF subfamily)|nr:RNA polymerase sigma factor [Bacteroidales bacterium]
MESEQSLVKECIRGNQKACEALYYRYAGRLLSICLRYIPQQDVAEDVLQETFIKVFQHLPSFEFRNKGALQAWMTRIIVNQALNYLRNKDKSLHLIDLETVNPMKIKHPDNSTENFNSLDTDEIHRCIGRLADGYRTVFNLYIFEDYSHKEIASLLEITESTSKTQLLKARALLKKYMEETLNRKKVLQHYGS